MEAFLLVWAVAWLAATVAPARFPNPSPRWIWAFPVLGLALLALFRDASPALRLAASSLLFLYVMKPAVLWSTTGVSMTWLDRALYMTIWPGMDPERVGRRAAPPSETASVFAKGLVMTLFGIGFTGLVALGTPYISSTAVGWLGIAGLLLTIHFGCSALLTAILWLSGRPVRPLFDRPLASVSLSDFWSRRWNLPFVDMDRRLFMPLLRRRLPLRLAVVAVFLVSGLLHEMAISYPAGGGWGGPILYFAIQALGVLGERRLQVRSRIITWAWILAPLPLLFHEAFRSTLILPFFEWMHALFTSRPFSWYVDLILWSLPVMQLSVLMASYQVPKRLNWHEELARLSPFNRKLMWTYAIFIVTTVISFAGLTIGLHGSFMKGETAAVGLAGFMSGFWVLRLLFDTFYYKTEDWPEGVDLQVGHALLNALFVYLVLGYGLVAVWGGLLAPRP